jgi:hypothetical protein
LTGAILTPDVSTIIVAGQVGVTWLDAAGSGAAPAQVSEPFFVVMAGLDLA